MQRTNRISAQNARFRRLRLPPRPFRVNMHKSI